MNRYFIRETKYSTGSEFVVEVHVPRINSNNFDCRTDSAIYTTLEQAKQRAILLKQKMEDIPAIIYHEIT